MTVGEETRCGVFRCTPRCPAQSLRDIGGDYGDGYDDAYDGYDDAYDGYDDDGDGEGYDGDDTSTIFG